MDHENYQTQYKLTPNLVNLMEINIEILGKTENPNSKLDTISPKLTSANNLKNQDYDIEILGNKDLDPSPQNHCDLNTIDKQATDSYENESVFIKQEEHCTVIKIEPYIDGDENNQETLHNTQIEHSLEDSTDFMDKKSQSSLQSVKTDITDNWEQIDAVVENTFDEKLDIKEELLDEVNDRLSNSLEEITKQKYSRTNKRAVKSEPEYTEVASADDLLIPNKELTYGEHTSPIEANADELDGPSSKKCRPRNNRSLSSKKLVEIAQTIKTKEKQKKKITKDRKHNQRVTKRKDISKTSIENNKKIKSENKEEEAVDTGKTIEPMLSCSICSYTTWNNTYMDLHLFKHEENERKEQGIFPCTICDNVFQDRPSWTKHLIQHNGKIPFKCYLCDFKCEKPSILVRHASTTHPEITRPFSCNVCDYKSANNSDIIRHTRTHTGEKPFSCKLCPYRCTDISSLGFHMRTHTGEKPYSCKLCDYRSKCNSALTSHMRRHTGERPYICNACDFKFANNSDRIRHMKLNIGDNFSCNLCEFNSTAKCALVKHLRSHTEVKKYNCVKCDFECLRKAYLLTHMRIHNGKNAYKCKDCEFKCDKYGKYSRHISIHTSEKSLHCEVCSFSCNGRHALGRHMNAEHCERNYSCEICDFKSWCKSDLASHLITHKCEKQYSCAQCEYTCRAGRTLKKHVQKIHVGLSEKEVII